MVVLSHQSRQRRIIIIIIIISQYYLTLVSIYRPWGSDGCGAQQNSRRIGGGPSMRVGYVVCKAEWLHLNAKLRTVVTPKIENWQFICAAHVPGVGVFKVLQTSCKASPALWNNECCRADLHICG
jgi:hypothetical protein